MVGGAEMFCKPLPLSIPLDFIRELRPIDLSVELAGERRRSRFCVY